MSKMVDSNKLAKLAAELDRRMKVEVQTEQERARIAEDAIQQNVDAVEEMLGGKSLRYVTQEEYDMLSEDEKNDPDIVWNITDAPEDYQTIKDENLNTEDKTIVGAINELNELIPCRDTRDTTVEFTFDGNSDGKVTIASGEDLQYYIKISDDIDLIQYDSIEVGKVKYVMTYSDGTIEEIEAEYIESCEGHDGEIGAVMIDNHDIYIVLKDNFEALILFREVTFPEKGIYVVAKDGYIKYHVSSVSLPGSTIKQLDEKFIPDTIARIDDVEEFVNDAINNIPEGFSGNYEDLTNKPEIPSKTSQLTNDSGFITGIPSEYVTSSELQQTLQPYNEELSEIYDWVETDFAKKEENLVNKSISENVLTLTTDKRQKVEMVDETEIVLPTVEDFTEIHLYFSTLTDLTLIFPAGKYQKTPEIKANKTYEFIFTYIGEWLIGYIEYGN